MALLFLFLPPHFGFFFLGGGDGEGKFSCYYFFPLPAGRELHIHEVFLLKKKSGCLPPLPLRSGANRCPADVGVGTPGDAPRQRLRMKSESLGKRGETRTKQLDANPPTPILEGDPSCGRIIFIPSVLCRSGSPPRGAVQVGQVWRLLDCVFVPCVRMRKPALAH